MRIVPLFSSDQAGARRLLSSLSRDPLADVWIAIRQRNVSRFALSEKIDTVLTCQRHILQIKNDAPLLSLRGDERLQLGDVLVVDPAAQGKYHLAIRRPVNSKQIRSPYPDFVRTIKQLGRQSYDIENMLFTNCRRCESSQICENPQRHLSRGLVRDAHPPGNWLCLVFGADWQPGLVAYGWGLPGFWWIQKAQTGSKRAILGFTIS